MWLLTMGDADLGDLEGGFQLCGLKVGQGLVIRPVIELLERGAPWSSLYPSPPCFQKRKEILQGFTRVRGFTSILMKPRGIPNA